MLLQDRTAFAQLGVQNAGTEPPWHRRISAPTAQDGRGPNPQRTRSAPARRGKPCARANDQARGAGPVLALTQPKPLEATHKGCRPGRRPGALMTWKPRGPPRPGAGTHPGRTLGSAGSGSRDARNGAPLQRLRSTAPGAWKRRPPTAQAHAYVPQGSRHDSLGHHGVVAATCTRHCPSQPLPAMRSRRRSARVDFPASSIPAVTRRRTASDLPQASSATCRLGAVWHRDTMLGSRASS